MIHFHIRSGNKGAHRKLIWQKPIEFNSIDLSSFMVIVWRLPHVCMYVCLLKFFAIIVIEQFTIDIYTIKVTVKQ